MARASLQLVAALALAGSPFALAACQGNDLPAPPSCTAVFSGNFADKVAMNGCADFGDVPDGGLDSPSTLKFELDSSVAGAPTNIAIDLGTVAVGQYSSETVSDWFATGINTGNCEFSAGSDSVPTGSFTLNLTAIAPAPSGTLSVTQYVKAPPTVDCGAGDTEQIDVTF